MEKIKIVENNNLMENLEKLEKMGYTRIIKANDIMLSGWGLSENKKHIQLIACTAVQADFIMNDLKKDESFNYVKYYTMQDKKSILNLAKGKTYTIRNDWTKCFNNSISIL